MWAYWRIIFLCLIRSIWWMIFDLHFKYLSCKSAYFTSSLNEVIWFFSIINILRPAGNPFLMCIMSSSPIVSTVFNIVLGFFLRCRLSFISCGKCQHGESSRHPLGLFTLIKQNQSRHVLYNRQVNNHISSAFYIVMICVLRWDFFWICSFVKQLIFFVYHFRC